MSSCSPKKDKLDLSYLRFRLNNEAYLAVQEIQANVCDLSYIYAQLVNNQAAF